MKLDHYCSSNTQMASSPSNSVNLTTLSKLPSACCELQLVHVLTRERQGRAGTSACPPTPPGKPDHRW